MLKSRYFFWIIYMAVLSSLMLSSCKKNSNNEEEDVTENPVTPDKEDEEGPVVKITPNVIVAADGSGNYRKLQDAIDDAPRNRSTYYYIYIKKGMYKEVITVPADKPYLYLIGEDPATTVLTYDNYAAKESPGGGTYGTSGSASFFVRGSNFVAERLTFENSSGMNAGQAVAINITGELAAFRNCRFLGFQDTWLANDGTKQYLKNCYIAGTVDFIFGGSTAYFQQCEIYSERNGYLTAAATPQNQKHGYVFDRCSLTASSSVNAGSVFLGRPWGPYAHVVFISCNMGAHIAPGGWNNWGDAANEKTANYAEFGSTGPGFQTGQRVSWSRQLSSGVANLHYSRTQVLGNWSPFVNWELLL